MDVQCIQMYPESGRKIVYFDANAMKELIRTKVLYKWKV